jgi:DNA-binding transcriptional ArsR family regulator
MGQGRRLHHPGPPRLSATAETNIDQVFTALADPSRRRAVELLGNQPRRAGDLAAALALPPPALSRHLRILKECGLVEETHPEFDARVRIYALKHGAMSELKRWLAATETMWATQLAALKAHIETPPE